MCISYIIKQVTSPGTSTFGYNLRLKLTEAIASLAAVNSLCLKYHIDRAAEM